MRYLQHHLGSETIPPRISRILSLGELTALRRVSYGMIVRAALAGALAGVAIAVAELEVLAYLGGEPSGWMQLLIFWAVVGTAGTVSTGLEIAFLYWDGLRSVRILARVASIDIRDLGDRNAEALLRALARAAFELPNPVHGHFAVNALRETSRVRVLLATVFYKLKIGLTSFVLKAVIRRGLGRMAFRVWLPLIAVPVTALWNAWVASWVISEARVRVIGPSAACAFIQAIGPNQTMRPAVQLAMLQAVGAVIVRSADLHPNVAALLEALDAEFKLEPSQPIDDSRRFLENLAELEAHEQTWVLQVLVAASVIDARVSRRERVLLTWAATRCNHSVDFASVQQLCADLRAGRTLDTIALTATIRTTPPRL